MDTESIKETVDALGISVIKARKVILTEGLWSSKKSLEIQHYLNLGKTTSEIADILKTREKQYNNTYHIQLVFIILIIILFHRLIVQAIEKELK